MLHSMTETSESIPPVQQVHLEQKLKLVQKQWTPHRIATFDGYQLVLAKVAGEFVWHDHADHDEVFMPLSGVLLMDIEGEDTRRVEPGELLVVPAGRRHRPRTEAGEVTLLVIDPLGVKHTGDVQHDMTVQDYPVI